MKRGTKKRSPAPPGITPARRRGGQAKPSSSVPSPSRPFSIRTILIPIDFSVHSHNALRYASRLAEQFGATLRLVYVVEPNVYPADLGFGQVVYPTYEEELVKKGTDELERTAREDVPAGVRAVSKVRTGKPHQEILADAREQKADLIVMATHGHTGVEHILFGSTAERVVRGAPCPVLTIRPDVPV